MRIKVLSDIHLEYLEEYPGLEAYLTEGEEVDVFCLCGDIGDPGSVFYRRFLLECAEYCKVRTLVIMGNHEAYFKLVSETERMIARVCEGHERLTFLQTTTWDAGGVRFAGATLWSAIDPKDTVRMRDYVADFRSIARWGVSECTRRHREHVAWLQGEIERARQEDKKLVVLTHHVPVRVGGDALQSAFSTDLSELIEGAGDVLAYWFYGHNHTSGSVRIGNTWVMSNQVGRVGEGTGFCRNWHCDV